MRVLKKRWAAVTKSPLCRRGTRRGRRPKMTFWAAFSTVYFGGFFRRWQDWPGAILVLSAGGQFRGFSPKTTKYPEPRENNQNCLALGTAFRLPLFVAPAPMMKLPRGSCPDCSQPRSEFIIYKKLVTFQSLLHTVPRSADGIKDPSRSSVCSFQHGTLTTCSRLDSQLLIFQGKKP